MSLIRPVADGRVGVATVDVDVVEAGTVSRRQDAITVEEPLQIRLIHGPPGERTQMDVAVTMRTPGDDTALALGFLYSEGVIESLAEVESMDESDNVVSIGLASSTAFDPQMFKRNTYMTSSCGVCSKASIEAVQVHIPDRAGEDRFTIAADTLGALPQALRSHQADFTRTGGVHASATFDTNGRIERAAEDVGRHNALDKLIGGYFSDGSLPLTGRGLLFSGRASFELVQKAAVAGSPLVAAIGPPSSLAIELAAEQRMTLVGFLRAGRFNVYTLPHRVAGGS